MGRPKDPFWQYAKKGGQGFECTFCTKEYKGSISRFKVHLAGLTNRDITPCEQVPGDVKLEALKAVEAIGGTNKRRKTIASTSANQIHDPTLLSSQQLFNEAGNQQRDEELMQSFWTEEGQARDWRISGGEVPNHIENGSEGGNRVIGEERMPMEVGNVATFCGAEEPNHIDNNPGEHMQLVTTRGDAIPTTELTYRDYEMSEIWGWLMDDDISIIGIYGMAGVGKTVLAENINNKLLRTPNKFHHVYWVTVSPDFSIYKLQKDIAKAVDLDISSIDSENIRAAKLSKALMRNKKYVLILDDVWNYIPLKKVGIPSGRDGCKLVLTTTSLEVCQNMRCQHNIEVLPLDFDKAWKLFMKELGDGSMLTPEIKEIAVSIVKECEGLALGIEVMARNMGGRVGDISEWRNALCNFRRGIQRPENKEVFLKLRRCFDNLDDPLLQQCFLYSALFLNHNYLVRVEKDTLIDYLIDEGIIKGKKSRQEHIDEGLHMLNRLVDLRLLHYGFLEKRKFMSRVAVQIMKESSPVLVNFDCGGEMLKELPDEDSWTEDLVRVSLTENEIEEIHPNHEPNCPNLLTLLLRKNYKLRSIPESFFKKLQKLQILDLSNSGIEELPYSLSRLGSLSALLLRNCEKLRQMPPLGELTALKKLDIGFSGVDIVPQGMELLSNLRYLNLMGTKLKRLPPGILPKLCRLQVLLLGSGLSTVKGEEIGCLRKLETLICRLNDVGEFNKLAAYLKSNQQLTTYIIKFGKEVEDDDDDETQHRRVEFNEFSISSIGKDSVFLPENIKELIIRDCDVERRFMLEKATKLELFEAENCGGLEVLMSFFGDEVSDRGEGSDPPLPPTMHSRTFSHIKEISIYNCQSLKKLFPCWMLSNLQNLESIKVKDCKNVEEIISQNGSNNDLHSFCLPKLNWLRLVNLPELKSICSRELKCESLEYLKVVECEKLQRLPMSLLWQKENEEPSPLPSLETIVVFPEEWWEGLQWEHPNIVTILSHLVDISF